MGGGIAPALRGDSQPYARHPHQRVQAAGHLQNGHMGRPFDPAQRDRRVNPAGAPTLRTGTVGSQGESRCSGIHKGEATMKTARNITGAISFAALWVTTLAGASLPARSQRSQETARPYFKMGPLDEYLMTDRSAEIAMARSAAPPSISDNAEVMVLGRHGYETGVKATNGFVCLVERSWMPPMAFEKFWNPKMPGPICFNPPAVRSILPLTLKRTELVLFGMSKDHIIEGIKAFDAK